MADEEKVIGEIKIKITDHNIVWDTPDNMTFPEVCFWLDITHQMMKNKFLSNTPED